MISYMCKRVNGILTFKRWVKTRTSNKSNRFHIKFKRWRKKWWHFKEVV